MSPKAIELMSVHYGDRIAVNYIQENNEVTFKADYIFTSEHNQANKFKISDANYIGSLLGEGTSLKYIY